MILTGSRSNDQLIARAAPDAVEKHLDWDARRAGKRQVRKADRVDLNKKMWRNLVNIQKGALVKALKLLGVFGVCPNRHRPLRT